MFPDELDAVDGIVREDNSEPELKKDVCMSPGIMKKNHEHYSLTCSKRKKMNGVLKILIFMIFLLLKLAS